MESSLKSKKTGQNLIVENYEKKLSLLIDSQIKNDNFYQSKNPLKGQNFRSISEFDKINILKVIY